MKFTERLKGAIKVLSAEPAVASSVVASFAGPQDRARIEALVVESQALGRQIDELREKRRVLRVELDALLGSTAPRDAVVQGQLIEVKAEK